MILNFITIGCMFLAFGCCAARGNVEGMLGWLCAIIWFCIANSN